MKHKANKPRPAPVRLCPDPAQGLSSQQAAQRFAEGWYNRTGESLSKSSWQIVRDNVFTFFNPIFFLLALCLLAVGAYTDMLFLGIVVLNVLIGIVQELRVKHTLDKIALLSAHTATVIRDGQARTLPSDQLVLDDMVLLSAGEQICADAILREGAVEVNESLLTGEPDSIVKRPGDVLLSGSYVTAGRCTAQLDRVGADCYAAAITSEARKRKKHRSQMMRSLDRWLTLTAVAIVPLGIIMFIRQVNLPENSLRYAVSSTVAAVVGMIPEGLYLLVSVALAVSVITLSRRRTLVHELSCIENLARVDTICLDKTGTITEGSLEVVRLHPAGAAGEAELEELLAAFVHASGSDNATAKALKERFPLQKGSPWRPIREIPFSSERKWSGLELSDGSCYLLGAPEMVLGGNIVHRQPLIEEAVSQGLRVLALAGGRKLFDEKGLAIMPEPLGYVLLADKMRPAAARTLAYFREQGVTVKVISGDNGSAVARIAGRAGVEGAQNYLDASQFPPEEAGGAEGELIRMAEETTVFGRVTPQQKRRLIRALKAGGHTVAMVGDGVNDVLALKEADCSIAMAAGSDAAQQVSQLVLLDSDFAVLPQIVREGRRVINNVGRSASLFLVKNIFSFLMSAVLLFVALPYPLVPMQVSLISGLMIGAPSFLLTFEPSFERVRGGFVRTALLNALPGGLTGLFCLLSTSWIGSRLDLPIGQTSSICTVLVGINGLMVLLFLCWPLTRLRSAVIAAMAIGFYGALLFLTPLFHIETLTRTSWSIVLALGLAVPALFSLLVFLISRLKRHLGYERTEWQKNAGPLLWKRRGGASEKL